MMSTDSAPYLPGSHTRSERRGEAVWLTMFRPEHDNRITPTMMVEMNAVLDAVESDDKIRAIVLTAGDPVFCLGCDHYELRTLGSDDPSAMGLVVQVRDFCTRLEAYPKPIIAAVDGDAKGGGFELLVACDIVIATERARIGDAHAGFTMPGAASVTRSVNKLGGSLSRYVQLTGMMLHPSAFLGCGFVTKVVTSNVLAQEVAAVIEALCSKTPAVSRRLKQALLTAATEPREVALAREYGLFDDQTREPEVTQGMLRLNEMLKARA